MMMPITWFPRHKGKVIGFIQGGFSLAATVFSPLQSVLVNPANLPPTSSGNNITNTTEEDLSSALYFTDPQVRYIQALLSLAELHYHYATSLMP